MTAKKTPCKSFVHIYICMKVLSAMQRQNDANICRRLFYVQREGEIWSANPKARHDRNHWHLYRRAGWLPKVQLRCPLRSRPLQKAVRACMRTWSRQPTISYALRFEIHNYNRWLFFKYMWCIYWQTLNTTRRFLLLGIQSCSWWFVRSL